MTSCEQKRMYLKIPLSQAGLDAMPSGGTEKLLTRLRFLETQLFSETPSIPFDDSTLLPNKLFISEFNNK